MNVWAHNKLQFNVSRYYTQLVNINYWLQIPSKQDFPFPFSSGNYSTVTVQCKCMLSQVVYITAWAIPHLETERFMKSTIFWDAMWCSPVEVQKRFDCTYCLHVQGRRESHTSNQEAASYAWCLMVTCLGSLWAVLTLLFLLGSSSTAKVEPVHSPKMLVTVYRTTGQHIPEDSSHCKNLKSSKDSTLFCHHNWFVSW